MREALFQIVLPASRIAAFRRDRKRLGPLLAISRASNAISLARAPLVIDADDFSPMVARERFAALFHAGAVLVEALDTAEKLKKHFAGIEQFDRGFGQLLSDSDTKQFRESVLRKFRDKGVFHFDSGFFGAALSQVRDDELVLGTFDTSTVADTYISIADDLMFDHILGVFDSDTAKVAAVVEFMDRCSDIMIRFLAASHSLVPFVLGELGAVRRSV